MIALLDWAMSFEASTEATLTEQPSPTPIRAGRICVVDHVSVAETLKTQSESIEDILQVLSPLKNWSSEDNDVAKQLEQHQFIEQHQYLEQQIQQSHQPQRQQLMFDTSNFAEDYPWSQEIFSSRREEHPAAMAPPEKLFHSESPAPSTYPCLSVGGPPILEVKNGSLECSIYHSSSSASDTTPMPPLLSSNHASATNNESRMISSDNATKMSPKEIVDQSWLDTPPLHFSGSTQQAVHSWTQHSKGGPWSIRFKELRCYRAKYGDCMVDLQINYSLAQWIKRQRHQYRLRLSGKHSTLTDDRVEAMNEIGFIWDSHRSVWEQRYNDLVQFKEEHGHCNVPTTYTDNPALGVWLKGQRRQFNLLRCGRKSTITDDRVQRLDQLGLQWNLRQPKMTKSGTTG